MTDFLAALGLVLVIEGVVWALFPAALARLGRMAEQMPEAALRRSGLVAVIAGTAIVWLVRG
ncbi:DUF2065 domain-containing protein [Mangrovicella endophytica]|uniref:DUF2065 domain-containing protein n=1 Tax=Mangrovicella endophytica TaxID=2066697 RepID=UPI000C9DFEC3|nr:DUF2065 domain-containing protein [Mangrovicella endophytica]